LNQQQRQAPDQTMLHKRFTDFQAPWISSRSTKNYDCHGFFRFFHPFTNDVEKKVKVAIPLTLSMHQLLHVD
jgi:hypothetical protein